MKLKKILLSTCCRFYSKINTKSSQFQQNHDDMVQLVENLKSNVRKIVQGDARSQEKHLKKGKMLVRDRIDALIDPGSPFLELSQLAAHQMYENQSPSAGIITGIGTIHG
ncbi:hypothetical protein M8J77_017645 [Diaphorina citri]|nr:hypothetical protein M8J77_017645 [Diaphorina citri]